LLTKKHRQRQNNGFAGVYPLGLSMSNGSQFAAVDEVGILSCKMAKPITHAGPIFRYYAGLSL